LSREENTQATPPPRIEIPDAPRVATPDVEKGSRGADFFPTMDPGSIEAIQSRPGPFDPPAEVPQGSVAPQSAPPESSD
jgi:hypothetical protein